MKPALKFVALSMSCALLIGPSTAWPAEAALAKVIALSGQVQVGARALKPGDSVAEGEEIASGLGGRATLEFPDSSVLRIRTDSRLRIEAYRGAGTPPARFETRLRLDSGAVEVVVGKKGEAVFRIATPAGNLVARNAEFRARARPEGLLVEVLDGVVAVAGAAGVQVDVGAGYGTQVKPAEAPLVPAKLLDAPDVSGIEALQQRHVVRLRFAPLPGAVRYRVVLATDRDLRDVIVESRPRRPDLRVLELDDGEYFYGVRAVDALGLDGLEARGSFRLKMQAQ